LEFLLEWGALACVSALLGFASLLCGQGIAFSKGQKALGWSTLFFVGHCLTGVQSQYPYLFIILAIGWVALASGEMEPPSRESLLGMAGRVFLVLGVLDLFSVSLWRMSADFDAQLALDVYRTLGPQAERPTAELFESSLSTDPTDGENWLQRGYVAFRARRPEEAYRSALAAEATDEHWAAPLELRFSADPLSVDVPEVSHALKIDPINYPAFYRAAAELAARSGKEAEALSLLRERAHAYSPTILDRLPDFRAQDLHEQLVAYWLLTAILEERSGHPRQAETAFRMALLHTQDRLSSIRALVEYPGRHGFAPGPLVGDLLTQVTGQIPSEDGPAPVDHPADDPI
jgi:hypothetical protein